MPRCLQRTRTVTRTQTLHFERSPVRSAALALTLELGSFGLEGCNAKPQAELGVIRHGDTATEEAMDASAPAECRDLDVPIDLRLDAVKDLGNGVSVEVVQRTEFTQENHADSTAPHMPRPELWDRSEMPAGACVFRITGITPSCYTHPDSIAVYHAPNDGGVSVSQASYYARRLVQGIDLCDWPIPGCPSSQWGGDGGYWWYLSEVDGATLMVMCATACERFLRAPVTLELRVATAPGLCEADAAAGG